MKNTTLYIAFFLFLLLSAGDLSSQPGVRGVPVSVGNDTVCFGGRFVVLYTGSNPDMELRNLPECKYFAPTWVSETGESRRLQHSESSGGDGIDETMNGTLSGRTFDFLAAAQNYEFVPTSVSRSGDTIFFTYLQQEIGILNARIEPHATGYPKLSYSFEPRKAGYYSVVYTGAESFSPAETEEVWQPMVWTGNRIPRLPYLTLAFNAPLPATLVRSRGVVSGVVVAPAEFPFNPLPTRYNGRFGVAVRDAQGNLRPMIAAPVLGGIESLRQPGETYRFALHLFTSDRPLSYAYEDIARSLYGFRDYRHNEIASINSTINNITEYTMSPYSNFIDSLKGCSYSTDVPGSTKNVSALNPMGVALLSDRRDVYSRRAYPIMEYMLSRERSLFCLDTLQKVQSPSRKMAGPCASVNELATLYSLSDGSAPVLLSLAGKKSQRKLPWYEALDMFRATGDSVYLATAVEGAKSYISVELPELEATLSRQFFWSSYAPRYINLLELYETCGDPLFLEAAHEGARRYAMFVWMSPSIPDEKVLVNEGGKAPYYWYLQSKGMPRQEATEEYVDAWRLSETGLVSESSTTGIGHRAVFMAHHAPAMYRIAHYTGDLFLKDIARSAIVGRYRNFPGYHINTARTTAYEKHDFPLRSHNEISVNSFHYNHQYPLLSVLYDFLITDVWHKSGEAIAFPSHYIEGYAYLQTRLYGDRPGRFYQYENVWLWMPESLLAVDHVELNYLTARNGKDLFIAFSNQCPETVKASVTLNDSILKLAGNKSYVVEVWRDNKPAGEMVLSGNTFTVEVSPFGLTAYVIKGVCPKPRFQQDMVRRAPAWKNDYYEGHTGGVRAMILNLGADLQSAFVYLQADDREVRKARLSSRINGGKAVETTDLHYPFEFTVPLPAKAHRVEMTLSVEATDGSTRQEVIVLSKK